MPNFLIVPSANVNGGGEVTSLTGAVVDTDTTLAPLVNGTEYRAFALANPSPPFTPAAPPTFSAVWQGQANITPESFSTDPITLTPAFAGEAGAEAYVFIGSRGGGATSYSVTINGAAATVVQALFGADNLARGMLVRGPAISGSTVSIAITPVGGDWGFSRVSVQAVKVVGGVVRAVGTEQRPNTEGADPISLTALTGDRVLIAAFSNAFTNPQFTFPASFIKDNEVVVGTGDVWAHALGSRTQAADVTPGSFLTSGVDDGASRGAIIAVSVRAA